MNFLAPALLFVALGGIFVVVSNNPEASDFVQGFILACILLVLLSGSKALATAANTAIGIARQDTAKAA